MNKPALPDTLSETLSLAIRDARLLDPSIYFPHNRFWHGYDTTHHNKCLVCLSGSIISQSFQADHKTITTPGSYRDEIDRKLRSINLVRTGDYTGAFALFHNRHAPTEIRLLLFELDSPASSSFVGWEQFESHLDSLEELLPSLREIEDKALSINS